MLGIEKWIFCSFSIISEFHWFGASCIEQTLESRCIKRRGNDIFFQNEHFQLKFNLYFLLIFLYCVCCACYICVILFSDSQRYKNFWNLLRMISPLLVTTNCLNGEPIDYLQNMPLASSQMSILHVLHPKNLKLLFKELLEVTQLQEVIKQTLAPIQTQTQALRVTTWWPVRKRSPLKKRTLHLLSWLRQRKNKRMVMTPQTLKIKNQAIVFQHR